MGLEICWWMCCTKRKGKRWRGWGDGERAVEVYMSNVEGVTPTTSSGSRDRCSPPLGLEGSRRGPSQSSVTTSSRALARGSCSVPSTGIRATVRSLHARGRCSCRFVVLLKCVRESAPLADVQYVVRHVKALKCGETWEGDITQTPDTPPVPPSCSPSTMKAGMYSVHHHEADGA